MLKKVLISAAVAGTILASAASAFAAKPAVNGCVGESLSALAGPDWGPTTVEFALETNWPTDHIGLGDELQAFQAGETPDFILPNTCN